MSIDLEKGISLKIEGELGRYQTLPVDALVKIAETLQELVLSIAKYDLPVDEAIDLNNFKLELTDFKKSSAVPSFVLTPRVQNTFGDFEAQRKTVNSKLNSLLAISDSGNYYDLKEVYPEYIKRNEIVEKLYEFTSSFKNSPVYVYEKDNFDDGYKPKKFKSEVRKKLTVKVSDIQNNKAEENAYASIKIIKTGKKVQKRIKEIVNPLHHSLSYSPEIITVGNRQYLLNFPLRCLFEKEEDFYVINNELLDIIGTGKTPDEAEQNFNEEFDFLHNRLNSLSDDKLSKRMSQIKYTIQLYIKEVL